ncbi:hypothetical protein MBSD_n1316 [Mizugakiibacter sediminis]|uniref:EamA domain-containing protein n=1 Tax=Mizugakiibacter sediminis TaxID=1475481 RepID=A0A0K8QMA9_9GAMM|nr:DMT family transporter [Mizugakiibacter sediminis]GAP66014.1 hypothetical protein MBSD_n1316 [Mizugakiibacter sediminis]
MSAAGATVAGARPRAAVWAMLAGAALISTTSIFVKWAHVPPTVSALYRMLFGGLMLAALLAARRRWRAFGLRELAWLAVPSLAFAVDLMLWHRSIFYVGPGLATLLGNFQVFVMALAGVLFYRERLGLRFVAGVALAMLGLWLLVGVDWGVFAPQYRTGVWFGILTGVAYAVYMLVFRRAQHAGLRADSAQLLALNSLLCAGVLALAVLVEGDGYAIPDAQSWASLLALALFGQVLGWMLIVRAMPRLPASLVGLLLLLQPALSFVLDVLLFARPTGWLDWCGLALSLAGIFIGSARGAPSAARGKAGAESA